MRKIDEGDVTRRVVRRGEESRGGKALDAGLEILELRVRRKMMMMMMMMKRGNDEGMG